MILVTGGAGFIGSVLVKELNKLGRTDIIIVDRVRDTIKWKNLRGLKFERYIHSDDLFNVSNDYLWKELEIIYHLGACSSTTELDMDYLFNNNVEYSKKLFLQATELGIPFIYASSAATYGAGEFGYKDDLDTIAKLLPLNRYGYSKQLFDEWVLRQKKKPRHWFGLKFFNVYGPNEYHKGSMQSIVAKSYKEILETGKMRLFKSHKEGFKDGEQLRDFVYGVDVARAIIELGNVSNQNKSGIVNIGTGEARSFKDLCIATFKAMGKEPNIEYIDMPVSIRSQYQYFTQADMTHFHSILPNFKFRSLEEGVTDYVQNYLMKDNPHC